MRLTAVPQREICMEGHKETGQPYRQILEAPSDESVRSNYKAVPFLVGVTWAVPGSRNAHLECGTIQQHWLPSVTCSSAIGLAEVR
jgi:hypothetical protein